MLLVSLLVASVQAADLDVELVIPNADPVQVTLVDVQDGKLPGLLVETAAGETFRLGAKLSTPAPGQHELAFVIDRLELDRKGRTQVTTVAQPTLLTRTNQQAEMRMGRTDAMYEVRATVRDEG